MQIKVSGCINACGHHHVGHIGVLGVEKAGEDWYQVLLGGRADGEGRLGVLIGKSVRGDTVPAIIAKLARHYLAVRRADERFIDTVERIGAGAFKVALESGEAAAA
jgi:sulfite reductase (NADPH) hemoprotein beta-component